MGNSFRNQPGPTLYPELKTPVTEDVLQVGLLFAFGIIAASFLIILPGIRGWEVRDSSNATYLYLHSILHESHPIDNQQLDYVLCFTEPQAMLLIVCTSLQEHLLKDKSFSPWPVSWLPTSN